MPHRCLSPNMLTVCIQKADNLSPQCILPTSRIPTVYLQHACCLPLERLLSTSRLRSVYLQSAYCLTVPVPFLTDPSVNLCAVKILSLCCTERTARGASDPIVKLTCLHASPKQHMRAQVSLDFTLRLSIFHGAACSSTFILQWCQ